MEALIYTEKNFDTTLETAKTLLPICTGYIVLLGPVLKFLWDADYLRRPLVRVTVISIFALAIAAIGVWSGTLAYLGNAAWAFGRPSPVTFSPEAVASLNGDWSRAILCAKIAHIAFFLSIGIFSLLAMSILFTHPRTPNDRSA